jgi:hypothetical protein
LTRFASTFVPATAPFDTRFVCVYALAAAVPTFSDSGNVVLPAEFVAVTVYVAVSNSAVGVPVIAPVVPLIASPVGSVGLTV